MPWPAGRWAMLGCAAVAAALPLVLLAGVVSSGANVPYWDEWEYAHMLYHVHTGALTLRELWQQHSEHRIFLNNVLVLALARLGGWDVVREQCLSVAVLVATQAVLWRIVRRTVDDRFAVLTFLVISIALYDVSQVENFVWGFQMCWFISNLCLVLATLWLTSGTLSHRRYLAAVAVAIVGSLTISQGLFIWAVGLACIGFSREHRAKAVAWTVVGAAVTFCIRFGIRPVTSVPHVPIAAHVGDAIVFALAYIGAPLAASWGVTAAACTGALELAALAALVGLDLRAPERTAKLRRALPWYAIALYVIIAAVLTAYVRIGFGTVEALSSRYATLAGLMPVALFGALAMHVAARGARFRTAAAVAVCAAIAGIGVQSATGIHIWKGASLARHSDVEAFRRGDMLGIDDLYPDPYVLHRFAQELRDVRDGIYGS